MKTINKYSKGTIVYTPSIGSMMKKLSKVTFILLLTLISLPRTVHCENRKEIPEVITSSFSAKYPNTNVRKWQYQHGTYTAKFTLDNHTSFATFDGTGNWINTVSNIRWTWNLPKNVNSAFKNSQYRSWNVYDIHEVSKPSGLYYQITVNNANDTQISHSEGHFATERHIEFNTDGLLTSTRDITYDPILGY
jgi:hypothetical protein